MLNFQLHPLTEDAFLYVSNPTLLPELRSQRTGDPWKHLSVSQTSEPFSQCVLSKNHLSYIYLIYIFKSPHFLQGILYSIAINGKT